MPQLILLNSDMTEIGSVDIDIDAEYGTSEDSTNDIEISTQEIQAYHPGGIYLPGTEIGGIFEYAKSKTDTDIQTLKAWTWRGLLTQSLILPPAGSNYKIVSGEANSIISDMLSNVLGGFFRVPSTSSGLTISSYQFPLYINTLDGLEGMLENYGYRLSIHADKISNGVAVTVEAVEATVIAGTYNDDSEIPMIFTDDNMGINHLLCAGSGELQARMKVDLYIGADGKVTTTKYYTGFAERTAFYDYSSAESMDDLVDYGSKRLLELASHRTLTIEAPDDLNIEVGDIAQGTFPDGTVVRLPIVKKIFRIAGGLILTEVEIKGGI